MALIICPECDGKVSDKANICPHCGYPISEMVVQKESVLYKIRLISSAKSNSDVAGTISAHIKRVTNLDLVKSMNIAISSQPIILNGLSEKDAAIVKDYFKQKGIATFIEKDETSKKQINIIFDKNNILKTDQVISLDDEKSEFEKYTSSLPKCPMCGSTNIQKISDFNRASSIIGFGILSKKIGKQWQCNNPKCKHLW